jgi:hypothetical protein
VPRHMGRRSADPAPELVCLWSCVYKGKGERGKVIPIIGHEGSYDCETSRLPHLLENRLTDGGEVVSLTRRPPFTPQENSWYLFLLEAESTPGP